MNSLMRPRAVGAADHDQPPRDGRSGTSRLQGCRWRRCILRMLLAIHPLERRAGRIAGDHQRRVGRKMGPHVVEAGDRPCRPSGPASA